MYSAGQYSEGRYSAEQYRAVQFCAAKLIAVLHSSVQTPGSAHPVFLPLSICQWNLAKLEQNQASGVGGRAEE